ncbi:ABC transporter substrate-binding protein [Reyranella sp. CPCC 100927]|uniref:ABC transporter substrate-binding protein n=1 Tax=Reyranella sp. CPCC 100927 TaxID=2599616 RepID=UPI0011B63927|nr:ABC transporter substrate-binding protein [Reyranella sp. CPCC 100927]TWT11875.1 ABC transporter substrate-binding protein [Reyranella sp. CPCC 100927]
MALLSSLSTAAFAQEKVIRIGMTAADIPRTSGQPDQGYEGNRFTGITIYDSLTQWDLSSTSKASEMIPGLALTWNVDPTDPTKWIFTLRPGVRFHDGSAFDADAVVWNVDKVLRKDAPQYDPAQIGATLSRMPTLRSARKIDDLTVEITTSEPDSFLPINLINLYMASPAHWEKKFAAVPAGITDKAERSKAAWTAFAADFSGTGPFRAAKFVPRERLEIVRNPEYWDATRRPKVDRLVMLPLPESSARTAALLSGQVDWIEAPAPDAVDAIKKRGFTLYTNLQPHLWPWQFAMQPGSPFADRRLRHAANLCVDRAALKELLSGLMAESTGIVSPGHPWRGEPTFQVRYDPAAARKLMIEAGYAQVKPARIRVQISASGSGQMQPLPMNEFIQQNLKACFFDVQFDVMEWNTLFSNWRLGAKDPSANGAAAINVSIATTDPFLAMARFVSSKAFPPVSNNWGYFSNPDIDVLLAKARTAFEPEQRDRALAVLHARIVDEAPFLFIAHDVSPRALSPKIKGVVQPRSWFIDFTTMSVD